MAKMNDCSLTNAWARQRAAQDKVQKMRNATELKQEVHSGCQHDGFVAREIEDDFRFVCRECNERFVKHPKAPHVPTAKTATLPSNFMEVAENFRDGRLTFPMALKDTGMTAEQFTQGIIDSFPPEIEKEELEHWEIGNPIPQVVTLSETEIKRTTPYEDVEAIAPTHGISGEELVNIWMTAFPDVVSVRCEDCNTFNYKTVIFEFIDGTKQRVDTLYKEFDFSKLAAPLVRSNYSQQQMNAMFGAVRIDV